MKIKVSEQDLADLILCGSSYLGDWKNLYYSLKNEILKHYGMFYGYTLQKWYDKNSWVVDVDEETGRETYDIHAVHEHILERYFLCTQDGKYKCHEFHSPTNEFSYFNYDYQSQKNSLNFFEFKKKCEQIFEGKKEKRYSKEFKESSFSALKRLVRKYGYLLYK